MLLIEDKTQNFNSLKDENLFQITKLFKKLIWTFLKDSSTFFSHLSSLNDFYFLDVDIFWTFFVHSSSYELWTLFKNQFVKRKTYSCRVGSIMSKSDMSTRETLSPKMSST